MQQNRVLQTACGEGQTKLTVDVKTDYCGNSDNSYEITNAEGVVVFEKARLTFADGFLHSDTYCLAGCVGYKFTMIDLAQDGFGCGGGYYSLTINDNTANTYTGGNNGEFAEEVIDLGTVLPCTSLSKSKAGKTLKAL